MDVNPVGTLVPVLHPQQPGLEDPRGGPWHAGAGGRGEARAHQRRQSVGDGRRARTARRRRRQPSRQQAQVMGEHADGDNRRENNIYNTFYLFTTIFLYQTSI